MTPRKLISIIIPVYDEEENIQRCYQAATDIMTGLSAAYDYEILYTDNHSSDRTFELITEIAAKDPHVRGLRFSRNVGYQKSIEAGYFQSRGDAAVQLDCDLQDPPELIPEFIKLWEEGNKIVYGIRASRPEGILMHGVRRLFYRLVSALSEDTLPVDAGDFRLVDRCILREMQKLEDCQPYLRGAMANMGFQQIGVPYARHARVHGESKFSLAGYIGIALDGILNHSIVPLRVASYFGFCVSVITLLMLFGYLIGKFLFGSNWPGGFATTTLLLLASLSINALFLGIIGEYLGRIYRQVKRQWPVIIEKSVPSL